MEDDNYQYTEKDVEIALRFLRLHLPKYANPENAVKVLVYCRKEIIEIEKIDLIEIEKLLTDFEQY